MKTNTKIKDYLHHINPCRCREPCVSFKVGDQTLAWPVLSQRYGKVLKTFIINKH